MTISQISKKYKIEPSSIRHAIRRGTIKACKPEGSRDWFITREEIEKYLNKEGKTGPKIGKKSLRDYS